MANALTIDLEYWHTIELARRHVGTNLQDQVIESVDPVLQLLDNYETRATFFVQGTLAEKYPEVVRLISKKGHEIASHGYSHKPLNEIGKTIFEEEIIKTDKILSDITGIKPIGFRAPTFSINNSTRWAFEVLSKHGYLYDSSIFPIKTSLYGMPNAPLYPYKPASDDITKHDPNGKITEFPLSVIWLVKNIPVSGGFYLRLFPKFFIKESLKTISRQRPAILYVHPWETYPYTPRLNMSITGRFITYYGINGSLKKMEYLLKNVQFKPAKEVLGL